MLNGKYDMIFPYGTTVKPFFDLLGTPVKDKTLINPTMNSPIKTKWAIDPAHTEISFRVRHLMITNVKWGFKDFSASVKTTGRSGD